MNLTVGRIVIYKVHPSDPAAIGHNFAVTVPAIITRVYSDLCVNLKVLTDGPTCGWKTSIVEGNEPGQWSWPIKEE